MKNNKKDELKRFLFKTENYEYIVWLTDKMANKLSRELQINIKQIKRFIL